VKRAIRTLVLASMLFAPALAPRAGEASVTGIKAFHRHGQTFVTWKDAAEGQAGAAYRYSVYRSDAPITQANLGAAQRVIQGILNNSCKFPGKALKEADRLDPEGPTVRLEEGGELLPVWTGVGVHTATKDGKGYYAVVATDLEFKPLSKIVPGKSATTEPVAEKVAPFQPILQVAAKDRKSGGGKPFKKGLPMHIVFHASCGSKSWRNGKGDEYLFFAPRWGYRSGLPGTFNVYSSGKSISLEPRDTITQPSGKWGRETYWIGYFCKPYWAKDPEPRAHLFTQQRLEWMIDWVVEKYAVDATRIDASGQSMGSWGSMIFGLPRPKIFSVLYPTTTPGHLWKLPALNGSPISLKCPTVEKVLDSKSARLLGGKVPLLPDGKTEYFDHTNMIEFVKGHPGDLPFVCYVGGRKGGSMTKGYCKWPNQVAVARALTAGHHGFGFGWDNGGHGSAHTQFDLLRKYYPSSLFALDRSYPAFGNSSIDDDPGPETGPEEGYMNVGFVWKDVADEAGRWSAKISNGEAKADMTADVTPRRCQKFKPKPGEKLKWTSSAGGSGQVTADEHGLVTVEKVRIPLNKEITLSIQR
jgi:hypothetical protein